MCFSSNYILATFCNLCFPVKELRAASIPHGFNTPETDTAYPLQGACDIKVMNVLPNVPPSVLM